jgi:hypothetical protein
VLLILQYTKNCGFYHFHKEYLYSFLYKKIHNRGLPCCFPQKKYLQMLKDASVITFRPSHWADVVDEVVDSVEC